MKLKFWIGILISVLCLYFVFRNIEFAKVVATLGSANYFYLGLSIILQLSTIWLRAERWKYLLAPIKQLTFRHLVPATMIGFMANNVLPARAGEFIRAYVIGKKENISKTASFVTIILERICDSLTMLLFLVIIILFVKFPQGEDASFISESRLKMAGLIAIAFIVCLVTFLIFLKEFPDKTTALVRYLLKPFPESLSHKALDLVDSFRMGLQVLKTGTHLFFLVLWSLSVWMIASLAAWMILWSFDLELPFLAGMFLVVITAFSVAIPSSPGYIGPFHAAVSASLLFFMPTFDKSEAAGIAIVFHLVCVIPITLAGIYYLWKENMSFSEIQHAQEEEETTEQEKLESNASDA